MHKRNEVVRWARQAVYQGILSSQVFWVYAVACNPAKDAAKNAIRIGFVQRSGFQDLNLFMRDSIVDRIPSEDEHIVRVLILISDRSDFKETRHGQ